MTRPFIKGDYVKMSDALKSVLRHNDSAEHVEEFGDCVGVVEDHAQGPNSEEWPELNVRWAPSGLRYAYDPEYLVHCDGPTGYGNADPYGTGELYPPDLWGAKKPT